MTDETLPVSAPQSAFLDGIKKTDKHIIDELFMDGWPLFGALWSWPGLRPFLVSLLGYKKARKTADYLQTVRGQDGFDYLSEELSVKLTLDHIERMPKTGRLVVAANHPTGLADGVAVWDALRRVRRDIVFFANADAIRVNPRFDDVVIPVEWVMDKRTPAKTRETLRLAKAAFEEEKCIVIFPSGKLAKMVDGQLTEQEWMSSVISLTRKYKAPVQPLNVDALNSWLYYFFARLNGELRDITLFHELLNKKKSRFDMTFGPLIQPDALAGETNAVTESMRNYVSYQLKGYPDQVFLSG